MGWEVGRTFMKEETYEYLCLIHVDVWQKPSQHCKAIICQLYIHKFNKKTYFTLSTLQILDDGNVLQYSFIKHCGNHQLHGLLKHLKYG